MSQETTSTPLWDARQRLAVLADRSRPAEDLEVASTGDPELFRFRMRDGGVEGFARIVEVDTEQQRSVIAVTGGTSTAPWSAAFELGDHAGGSVSGPSAGDDALPDPATTRAWLEALTPVAGHGRDGDGAEPEIPDAVASGRSGVGPGFSRGRPVAMSGVAALVLAAIAWWWRSAGPVCTRRD